jgi:hypothetical protein
LGEGHGAQPDGIWLKRFWESGSNASGGLLKRFWEAGSNASGSLAQTLLGVWLKRFWECGSNASGSLAQTLLGVWLKHFRESGSNGSGSLAQTLPGVWLNRFWELVTGAAVNGTSWRAPWREVSAPSKARRGAHRMHAVCVGGEVPRSKARPGAGRLPAGDQPGAHPPVSLSARIAKRCGPPASTSWLQSGGGISRKSASNRTMPMLPDPPCTPHLLKPGDCLSNLPRTFRLVPPPLAPPAPPSLPGQPTDDPPGPAVLVLRFAGSYVCAVRCPSVGRCCPMRHATCARLTS